MSNEAITQLIATLVGMVVANWAVMGPLMGKAIKLAWVKSMEWQKMLERIDSLEKRADKAETDVTNAHAKIRSLKSATPDKTN